MQSIGHDENDDENDDDDEDDENSVRTSWWSQVPQPSPKEDDFTKKSGREPVFV